MSTQLAICCDKKMFLTRWIKAVTFFAAISIVFWLVFVISPDLVNLWPAKKYLIQIVGSDIRWSKLFHGKGLLIYSYLEAHPTRNCGFYTEPGVYQIVLNSAFFVLLFWKDKLHFRKFKQYRNSLIIILAALITCQSTTGYIGMLLILVFFYVFMMKKDAISRKTRRYINILVVVGIIVLLIDYTINTTESILHMQIFKKLFGGGIGSGLDISESTGSYRMGTIMVSLMAIAKNPFGIGYDAFNAMRIAYGDGLVAASVASFAAIYGVIPWIIVLVSVFKPVFDREKKSVAFLYLLLFFNTTLAQTDLFYPSLIMIPMYLLISNTSHVKRRISHRGAINDV